MRVRTGLLAEGAGDYAGEHQDCDGADCCEEDSDDPSAGVALLLEGIVDLYLGILGNCGKGASEEDVHEN